MMTNAQVALLAAGWHAFTGATAEDVQAVASEHLSWLAAQDTAADTPEHPPQRLQQCDSLSRGKSRCDQYLHHDGKHVNGRHGLSWGDDDGATTIHKPAQVLQPGAVPVHFIPAPTARHTTCGRLIGPDRKTTTFVRDTTCLTCKEELGL